MNQPFYTAGMRFINIEEAMPIKSYIEIEFFKFLQVRGSGIVCNGNPTTPREFRHDDAVHYFHLEHLNERDQLNAIRRAVESAVEVGYDNYKMKRTMYHTKWEKVN